MTNQDSVLYYRKREAAARLCASRASDPSATRVHLQLADEYARVAEGEETVLEIVRARGAAHVEPDDV